MSEKESNSRQLNRQRVETVLAISNWLVICRLMRVQFMRRRWWSAPLCRLYRTARKMVRLFAFFDEWVNERRRKNKMSEKLLSPGWMVNDSFLIVSQFASPFSIVLTPAITWAYGMPKWIDKWKVDAVDGPMDKVMWSWFFRHHLFCLNRIIHLSVRRRWWWWWPLMNERVSPAKVWAFLRKARSWRNIDWVILSEWWVVIIRTNSSSQ